ncbi:hypothetical protein KR032_011782 [Drosophila birchii]|nr:hypothetical protein KR032_011782 [Drosophila birchii]
MSMMQFGPRTLLSQRKLATATAALTCMYGTEKKITPRPWRPEQNKASDPLPCYLTPRRSENRCNDPRFKATDEARNMGLRRRRLELQKQNPTTALPCYLSKRRSENRCNQPRLKPEVDECIPDPCGLTPLPMDLEHYTPSDLYLRKYQRTWCEAYALPTKFSNPEKSYPNRPRRKLRQHSISKECVIGKSPNLDGRRKPEKLVAVQHLGEWPCCKLVAPGCGPVRAILGCRKTFPLSCCKKRRTQYPSFSECQPEGLLDPIPPCECEQKAMLCQAYAAWRRFHKY